MSESNSTPDQRVAEIFKRCRALHHKSYPQSPLDFDRLDLTERVTRETSVHARGGFSDVYRGRMDDGIVVAVKTLRLPVYTLYNDTIYQTALRRFFREINIWSTKEHPNVAPCLGYTLTGANISLISTWHENGNLVEFLQRSPCTNEADLILDVAEGTQYLHTCSNPLIHGDLKGENVLVSEHGIARLADFGISKQIDDLNRHTGFTTTSGVTGTMPWMAPELDGDSPITLASDLYSCAGVFLEICCPGKTPYYYLKPRELVRAKDVGKPPDLLHYPEMAAKTELWGIMSACWAHDPVTRPSIARVVQSLYSLFKLSPRVNQVVALRPAIGTTETPGTGEDVAGAMEGLRPDAVESDPGDSGTDNEGSTQTLSQLMAEGLQDIPLKKNGDWRAMLNPEATRTLDITLVMTLTHNSRILCVQFSPDAKYLAAGSDGVAYVYDTASGEKTHTLAHHNAMWRENALYVYSISFSPNGKLLATGTKDCRLQIWDLAEGKNRTIFDGHTGLVKSVAFSPGGSKIVSGSWDGSCRIWDLQTGEAITLNCTRTKSNVHSVAFSPNGLLVAAGYDDCIVRIWDAATGDLVEELKGHTGGVESVLFTPDGRNLLSGSLDKSVKCWSLESLPESQSRTMTLPKGVILPFGQHPALPESREIGIRCIASFLGHEDWVLSVATSRDGSWVVAASEGGTVGFWDMKHPGAPQLMLHGHKSGVFSVDMGPPFTPGTLGGLLATGSHGGSARIWKYSYV